MSLTAAIIAILFVVFTAKKVLKFSQGTEKMAKISASISSGANAFLKRQYSIVGIFFACMFVIIFLMAIFSNDMLLAIPFAFLSGGFFSGLSGFIGMKIATAANARTAQASSEGLNKGLRVAFSAGSVMGFTVVGLGLIDTSLWYLLLNAIYDDPSVITGAMVTFGMGASSMALFARVGGGIFTKAADVGADLVGKVEAGIPEDDPRNPAVIADNVGDNVGDVAGMGADLYESYVGSILSCCALGVAALAGFNNIADSKAIVVPLAIAAIGVIASIIGTFFVRTKENASQKVLLSALRKGTNFSAIVIAIAAFPVIYFVLGQQFWGLYIAVLAGLLGGVAIGAVTEYYTSDTYKPTQKLAGKSETGSATIIIGGLGLGMLSTAVPIVIV
ncbi:MAG: sodium/proton-translocating pyrophosphatase, partial [Clostridia bacterium]|nr:sodium/proton-translocating pyrophosphatase [Clostridia bacterium]